MNRIRLYFTAAFLLIGTLLAGIPALSAQSAQELAGMTTARQEMMDKASVVLRADPIIAAWDSMVIFQFGTNKRVGKFVNLEFDKNGLVLRTDVYVYEAGVEARTREEMKWQYNFPYYHPSYEYDGTGKHVRLTELKQTVSMMGMNIVTTIAQKWDTNGLLTQYNISNGFGTGSMNYSVVSKADARNRAISEERTGAGGVYWKEYYEYGTNGKMSKLTRQTSSGTAATNAVTTSSFSYNSKNMITQVVDETVSAEGKYTEKSVNSYDSRDRLSRTDFYNDKNRSSLVQTEYALYYYGGGTGNERIETSDVAVYPNPASGEIRIENHVSGIRNMEIFDVSGRSVAGIKTMHATSLQSATTLDISCLPAGVYFLRIETGSGVETKKLVKVNK